VAGIAFIALFGFLAKLCLAERLAVQPDFQHLRYALTLDPQNPEYNLKIGRLYQYSPVSMEPEQAVAHLERAARLSPYDPQVWLDLASALEFENRNAEAEESLRRADYLAPRLPPAQWAIGNYYLLHGNMDECFRHFRTVLEGDDQYMTIILNTAWKASGDPGKILNEVIPPTVQAEFEYLNFLAAHQQYEAAASTWKHIARTKTFEPVWATGYLENLIAAHRIEEAGEVWTEMGSKGDLASTYGPTGQNLMVNGEFEQPVLSFGFDWRIAHIDGAFAGIDPTVSHSPGHSVLVQFAGTQNVNYQNVFQFVRVNPNQSYRLKAYMKAEAITTDSGPRLEVRDILEPRIPAHLSEDLRGSTPWTPVSVDFKTSPRTRVIAVLISRRPSTKLDNQISGKVWVDDVTLAPATSE
jgi:hypothetical protein